MKTNIIILAILAFAINSCVYPKYLPSSDTIDINQYGSFIRINNRKTETVAGELISIDSSTIVILTKSSNKCISVLIKDVNRFSLRYAKPKQYGWTIPVYTLSTIIHGSMLVFTAPINLMVTLGVTMSSEDAFQYNEKNMSFEKLKMFARFPQGIPPNLDLASITEKP
jgi:hypothetical protein